MEGDGEFKIVCPFHGDVNASMQISLSENFFFCHGCGEHGNAMHFVRLVNKDMDDLDACKEYYRILHSNKVKHITYEFVAKKHIENKQALVEAKDYYFGLKSHDWVWDEETFEGIYMQDRGFYPDTLNICKAKINYSYAYPIIFPMFDMEEFKGWVCRTMDKNIQKKRKYLYNEGFSRRSTLVGTYNTNTVVVVEGYMDWLKFRQYGIKNVVAILGWKATKEQIQKLKEKGVQVIISALDNDKCGKDGTTYLEKYFKVVRFQFPEGTKDPGEMDANIFKIAYEKTKKLRRKLNGIN